jgi:hypothetical protein
MYAYARSRLRNTGGGGVRDPGPVPGADGDTGSPRIALLAAAALLVAAVSVAVDQTVRFDPEGWLRWGRELAGGAGPLDTSGLPSWKPLPVVVTAPLAAVGLATPAAWLVLARAAGLLALGLMYRLTARRAGPLAGVAAAGVLAATPAWWTTLLGGGIEPVTVALGCGAVAAHAARRRGAALALLVLMALGREEALILVAAYGAVLARERRGWAVLTAGACGLVLAAWLGGDWLGSGDPLRGGALARAAGAAAPPVRVSGLGLGAAVAIVPQLVALAGVGALAAWRGGDRLIAALAAAALAWIAIDLALLALGYPLPARFLIPAAAAAAAPAGLGIATVRAALTRAARAWGFSGRRAT